MAKKRVAVGLSGGVDSAVSALLLRNKGYEVVGVHLYCWPPESEIKKDKMTRREWFERNGCRADEDKKSALRTALELEIPFKRLDFSKEYKVRVVDYFYAEYEAGRTPNPDVLCNSEIKFGLFLDWALRNGFDYVATGHYARVVGGASYSLRIPKDRHKDQTYFLWKLGQEQLRHTLFPLSDYLKSEVRKIARENKLSVAERKDSQGICFVGDVDVREFLRRRLNEKKGVVVSIDGEVIGEHDGVWFYTIGQRGGWRINSNAQKRLSGEGGMDVLYVISKNVEKNELVVGFGASAYKDGFEIEDVNWIDGAFDINERVLVRIRHGGELLKAGVRVRETGKGFGRLMVRLAEPQRGVASGQSAVFYSGDGVCLGGGVIE